MIQKLQDDREVLLIDMDNTLNQFWIGFQNTYNEMFDNKISLSRFQLVEYEILINLFPEMSVEERHLIRQKIFEHTNFWLNQPVYEDATKILEKLHIEYNIYIITSPWTSALNCYTEKIQWLQLHFPFIPLEKVIFTRDKWLVRCDYIIDDAPFYLEREDCKTIAMDYEYNKHVLVNHRTDNWKDIGKYLGVEI